MVHETILFFHFVTDEDGDLKLKQTEGFHDTITYQKISKAIAEAKAAEPGSIAA